MIKNVSFILNNNVKHVEIKSSDDIYITCVRIFGLDETFEFEYVLSTNNVRFNLTFQDIVDNSTVRIQFKSRPEDYSEVSQIMDLEMWRPIINANSVTEEFRGVLKKGKLFGRFGAAQNFSNGVGNFSNNVIALNMAKESYDETCFTSEQVKGKAIFEGVKVLDNSTDVYSDRFTLYWLNTTSAISSEYPGLYHIAGCGIDRKGKYRFFGVEYNRQVSFLKSYY